MSYRNFTEERDLSVAWKKFSAGYYRLWRFQNARHSEGVRSRARYATTASENRGKRGPRTQSRLLAVRNEREDM